MSADHFTEVTGKSWFSRIAGAFKGIILGILLFLVSFPLLVWNEGRAVQRFKTLTEGGKIAISVPADRVDAANAGKLVHVTGRADTDARLSDTVFGVSAQALKLLRNVEMYQWQERKSSTTRKKFGGGSETVTTYDYDRTWSGSRIDSSSFKHPQGHENPAKMLYDARTWTADPVRLGAYRLPSSLVAKIDNFTPLPVQTSATLPAELGGGIKTLDAGYYVGENPAAPQIGDLRISFKEARPTEVSVIARQLGDSFEPYPAKAGGTIELLQLGTVSAESMFQTAQRNNQILTWVLRGVGFLLMLFGLNLILAPLSVLADIIPFVGSLVGAGTGLIALLLAIMLSLITVACSWVAYRPVLAALLIAGAVGVTVLIKKKMRRKTVSMPIAASAPEEHAVTRE